MRRAGPRLYSLSRYATILPSILSSFPFHLVSTTYYHIPVFDTCFRLLTGRDSASQLRTTVCTDLIGRSFGNPAHRVYEMQLRLTLHCFLPQLLNMGTCSGRMILPG